MKSLKNRLTVILIALAAFAGAAVPVAAGVYYMSKHPVVTEFKQEQESAPAEPAKQVKQVKQVESVNTYKSEQTVHPADSGRNHASQLGRHSFKAGYGYNYGYNLYLL